MTTSSSSDLWQPLAWDTNFFGVATARITKNTITKEELLRVIDEATTEKVEVLHFLAASDDRGSVLAAEHTGFSLVDMRATYTHRLSGHVAAEPTDTLRNATIDDLEALQAIARVSYLDTRFFFDEHYSPERAAALYARWVVRDFEDSSTRVIVSERNGSLGGFITCSRTDALTGKIGLVGVHEAMRGQGIGRNLVRAAQSWCVQKSFSSVEVVTQGRNIAAQRLYQSCGFLLSSIYLWYHKWLHI